MDFKSLITKLDSMEAPPTTPAAPTLPQSIQLNEDAQLRVLAGTSSISAEKELMEKKLTAAEKDKKEEVVKSMKKDKAGFKDRYGEKGEEVMHATATKIAKKTAEGIEDDSEAINEYESKDGKYVHKGTRGADYDAGSDDSEHKEEPKKKEKSGMTGAERREQAAKDKAEEKKGKEYEKTHGKGSVTRVKDGKKVESVDPEQFRSKFMQMVEAAKKDKVKGKKAEEKMDEGSKPDFLDIDKDGDKKEPMKKAAADKGGESKDGKKGMSAKQEKYFGKKNESKMMPKGKKRPVKESVEQKLSFREMMKLVVESGGQQQIDPLDKTLFSWATRIAENKFKESAKAEVYAGLVYERMGGRFEMYDVLSESKKNLNESVLTEGVLGKVKDYVMSKILPKLSSEDKNEIQSAVQQVLGKSDVSMSDFTPENIKAVAKAMGASPNAAKESMSMEGDDPFYHKDATIAEKLISMVGIGGGLAALIASFTTGPAWLMIPGIIGLAFMSQAGTSKRGSGPAGSG